MSLYAERKHVVTAIRFDGTDASALAIVKEFGDGVAMSAKDGAILLTLSRKRAVDLGDFVFRKGDLVTALPQDRFEERFQAVTHSIQFGMEPGAVTFVSQGPESLSNFRPPPSQTVTGFRVGDKVIEIGGSGDVLTVEEIDGGILLCDGPWGEKKLKPSKVEIVGTDPDE